MHAVYGHDTNEWFGKDVSHCHTSMQIDMNLEMLLILSEVHGRQLCKTDKIKLS